MKFVFFDAKIPRIVLDLQLKTLTILYLDSQIKINPRKAGLTQPIRGFGYSLSQNTRRFQSGRLTQFGIGAIPDKQVSSDSVAAVITSHPTVAILPDSFKSQIIATADNSNSPGNIIVEPNN